MRGMLLALTLLLAATGAHAAGIAAVYPHGGYETGGVIITLSGANGNESATLEIKGPADTAYRRVHDFVPYDANNMATSLFGLTPGTTYNLRITLSDPDGVSGTNPRTAVLTTLPPFTVPTPAGVITVGPAGADYTSLQAAVNAAAPGTEIRVMPGTYGPVSISGFAGTADAPLVIRAADPANRPVIDGANGTLGTGVALSISNSSYVIVDGLEIRNGGSPTQVGGAYGVRLSGARRCVIRNSFIHDNGWGNVYETAGSAYNLVENNVISDEQWDAANCPSASYQRCPNQTYYGIVQDGKPGPGSVYRGNRIYGVVDGASLCGDERAARNLAENTAHVLALTGGAGSAGWGNHNLDFHDNLITAVRDDAIEADGICVNARIFRNRMGDDPAAPDPAVDLQNAISISPSMPGPYFFVRNIVDGQWGEGGVKTNTAGQNTIPIRNIFLYHNTFVRRNSGTLINLWYALPGAHNVPVKNIVYRNNVFWNAAGGKATSALNNGQTHPSFDYDLWYTPSATGIFQWWSNGTQYKVDSFGEFRQVSGQEANGRFAAPLLDGALAPMAGSPALDAGLRLPGINDGFAGSGPDLGAVEAGTAGGGDTRPPVLALTSPTGGASYDTTTTPLALAGTATDDTGVVEVSWRNDRGGSGIATGTASWQIPAVDLMPGTNTITITARDAAGNTASLTLTVTYDSGAQPPPATPAPGPAPAGPGPEPTGGCTLGPAGAPDPTLPLLLLAAALGVARSRRPRPAVPGHRFHRF